MKQPSARLTASTAVLATMLGLTPRRVQQLAEAKIIPQPILGRHDLLTAIPAYIEFLKRPAQSASLADAKQRKIELETQLKQLELDSRRGELVSKAATDAAFFAAARRVRDGLFNLPDRVSGPLSAGMDQHAVHNLLTKELRQILEELTDGEPQTKNTETSTPRSR